MKSTQFQFWLQGFLEGKDELKESDYAVSLNILAFLNDSKF